jgi:hypothetical protein
LRLHEEPTWLVLLHYRPGTWGVKSVVDDPRFFNSPEGKTDPEAELRETVKVFFGADRESPEHPQCRFPARYAWLKEKLGFDGERLPEADCADFREFMERVDPTSAALVFPESYMNAPASMFGHTFIRVDSSAESKLLAHAVNYSAVTGNDPGFLYAVRGLSGGYKGYFSFQPYYDIINTYSHMENRDMWEYPLNLTEEEVRKMTLHVWEMNNIYTDYYFFDDNCSYILLFLIEAARPEMELTEDFLYWVIPVDTVRLLREKGLISGAVYRPSRASRMNHMAGLMKREHLRTARDVALGKRGPDTVVADEAMNREEKVRTLDIASEYLQYRSSEKKLEHEEYTTRFLSILEARSTLGKQRYDIPPPVRPEDGHGSSRLALGGGIWNHQEYQSLRFRFAYHDLMDPDPGFRPGAAISFLDTEVRYNYDQGEFSIKELTLVEIASLSPVGTLFRPVSWTVKTGLRREEISDDDERTVFGLKAGGGVSADISGALLYGLLQPAFKTGEGLSDDYALGGGFAAGLLIPVGDVWKMQGRFEGLFFELGDEHKDYAAEVNQMFRITTNNAIKFNIIRRKLDGFYSTDVNVSWNRYF